MKFHQAIWYPIALTAVLAVGCSSARRVADRASACRAFDSLYAQSGFEQPVALVGKATIDAEQHRLRAKVDLKTEPSGDVYLDFASSVLFGAQREDFFFSMVSDTIRIIDRERGEYFEADDAETFLASSLGMDFGARNALGLALGRPPECERLQELDMRLEGDGSVRFSGRVDGAAFRVVFAPGHRRLAELRWPLSLEEGPDELLVTYQWSRDDDGGYALHEVVMWLEDREWRCRITSATG